MSHLSEALAAARAFGKKVVPGCPVTRGIYQHYKNGHYYLVHGVVHHTETREEMALYQALYDCPDVQNQWFVRPLGMFMEQVEHEGKQVQRFTLVEADEEAKVSGEHAKGPKTAAGSSTGGAAAAAAVKGHSSLLVYLAVFLAILLSVTMVSAKVTPLQRHTIMQLTSIFENSTPVIQYAYCENIGDGRGYTAGEAGFTTGTHDLLVVVREYTKREPNNTLAQFLPALVKVDGTNSTVGLDGLCGNWSQAATNDALFRKVQDDITDNMYFNPSQKHADDLGLTLPLSRGQMYDAIIQHGDGDDPDGLPNMLSQTNTQMQGTPKTGVNEKLWLNTFFNIRAAHLLNASDPSTEPDWAESVDRVYCYGRIANSSNYQLALPFSVTAYGDPYTLTNDTSVSIFDKFLTPIALE